jgi:hypothetical protein
MNPTDFVFVIYESYFGICTKDEWNKRGGYLSSNSATPEDRLMMQNISPEFDEAAESMWSYRGGLKKHHKEARKLLLSAGMQEVEFTHLAQ